MKIIISVFISIFLYLLLLIIILYLLIYRNYNNNKGAIYYGVYFNKNEFLNCFLKNEKPVKFLTIYKFVYLNGKIFISDTYNRNGELINKNRYKKILKFIEKEFDITNFSKNLVVEQKGLILFDTKQKAIKQISLNIRCFLIDLLHDYAKYVKIPINDLINFIEKFK
jgi:hypothetical protein